MKKLKRRHLAVRRLDDLHLIPKKVLIAHYSASSLSDTPDGFSKRVTCITVMNLDRSEQRSFSIHKEAEIQKIKLEEIEQHYDSLELKMLEKFYDFIRENQGSEWIYWNMDNDYFGFPAIEHRYRVLGGTRVATIPSEKKHNLPSIIREIYGNNYVAHPQMENLIRINDNGRLRADFIMGKEEPAVFKNKEFFRLQNSTICKVKFFSDIVNKIYVRNLKVAKRNIIELLFDAATHPFWAILAIISSIITVVLGVSYFLE